MRTVAQTPTMRYAVYHCFDGTAIYGTAEFLRGYGWLFREDNGLWMEIVTPHDLLINRVELLGLIALADAQLEADLAQREAEAQAGRCAACGMIGCRGDATCAGDGTVTATLAAMRASYPGRSPDGTQETADHPRGRRAYTSDTRRTLLADPQRLCV